MKARCENCGRPISGVFPESKVKKGWCSLCAPERPKKGKSVMPVPNVEKKKVKKKVTKKKVLKKKVNVSK